MGENERVQTLASSATSQASVSIRTADLCVSIVVKKERRREREKREQKLTSFSSSYLSFSPSPLPLPETICLQPPLRMPALTFPHRTRQSSCEFTINPSYKVSKSNNKIWYQLDANFVVGLFFSHRAHGHVEICRNVIGGSCCGEAVPLGVKFRLVLGDGA